MRNSALYTTCGVRPHFASRAAVASPRVAPAASLCATPVGTGVMRSMLRASRAGALLRAVRGGEAASQRVAVAAVSGAARLGSGLLPTRALAPLSARAFASRGFGAATAQLAEEGSAASANELAVPKLEDANLAGGPQASSCTLIVTEGDSAKALAVSGLSIVGRDRYGVFPLRGKVLNVRDASPAQLAGNDTIVALKSILGLRDGTLYSSTSSLRYGKLMIMTDQDHDGSHIKGLIINFLHAQFPSLLKLPGFVQVFITPILKASRGKTVHSFYTLPQFDAWAAAQPGGLAGWSVKYYKGLGTSTAAEAKEYFSNLEEHTKTFLWRDAKDGDAIELAFSPRQVAARKEWLRRAVAGTYLDPSLSIVPYSEFIDRELILFSLADLQRSLPHWLDGLKPSQRKVLHCAFKRRLTSDIKVAQLAGYVGEHAAYHHGEASLTGTIVSLAQDFTGARNINLLVPSGQFGTRLAGGKDAASPRYIYTRLSPLARALFPEADDGLLDYIEEDGQRIEPRSFLPVLPLLLINGSEGIGTGWSTAVPGHNPRDVLAAVRAVLDGKPAPELRPWFRGFAGTVTPLPRDKGEAAAYAVDGTYEVTGPESVVVTELPVGHWTADYRTTLNSLIKAGTVTSFSDHSTDAKVRFELVMPGAVVARLTKPGGPGLLRALRLNGHLSTGNMHTYDANAGGVQRYATAAALLAAFVPRRLEAYKLRQQHAVTVLRDHAQRLTASRAFLGAVAGGTLKLDDASDAELAKQLAAMKAPRMPREPPGPAGSAPHVIDAAAGPLAGWEYLLDIPHAQRTAEAAAALAADAKETAAALAAAERATPEALWRADLDAFEAAYDAAEAEARVQAEEREAAAKAAVEAYEAARAAQQA